MANVIVFAGFMAEPFIRNHQYNLIKKQASLLQLASNTIADPRVMEAVKYSTAAKVIDAFPWDD